MQISWLSPFVEEAAINEVYMSLSVVCQTILTDWDNAQEQGKNAMNWGLSHFSLESQKG